MRFFIKHKVLFSLFLLCINPLFSLEKTEPESSFYIIPYTGSVSGKIGEYLYRTNGSLCSYLDWKETFIPLAGIKSGGKFNDFNYSFSAFYKFPFKCGQMTDSDYDLSGNCFSFGQFPLHNDFKNYGLDFNFSYDFHPARFFTLSPVFQLAYRHYSFYSESGSGWILQNDNKKDVRFSHIEYMQQSYFLFTGLKAAFTYNKIDINFSFLASPLALNYSLDYHADDNSSSDNSYTSITKQITSFYSYLAAAEVKYKISENFSLLFESDFLIMLKSKGPTGLYENYYKEKCALFENPDDWKVTGQNSANSIFEAAFTIGCVFYLK